MWWKRHLGRFILPDWRGFAPTSTNPPPFPTPAVLSWLCHWVYLVRLKPKFCHIWSWHIGNRHIQFKTPELFSGLIWCQANDIVHFLDCVCCHRIPGLSYPEIKDSENLAPICDTCAPTVRTNRQKHRLRVFWTDHRDLCVFLQALFGRVLGLIFFKKDNLCYRGQMALWR